MYDIKEHILELSENNSGAASVMLQLAEYLQQSTHIGIKDLLELLEVINIRGIAIWLLFKDLAKENIGNFTGILTAVGHVLFSEVELKEALIKGRFSRDGVLKEISEELKKNCPQYEIKMDY